MSQSCKDIQVMSRVVGFYSPINQWNKGKAEEFKMRKTLKLNEIAKAIEEDEEAYQESEISAFAVN